MFPMSVRVRKYACDKQKVAYSLPTFFAINKMITNPRLKLQRQISPIAVGLEGSVVELYHASDLYIVAREKVLSKNLFRQYGTLVAQCEFEHSYVGALRKLAPFVEAENDLNPGNILYLFEEETHRIQKFTRYDENTVNAWRRHINGGLIRDFKPEFKTVFSKEPQKYKLH